MARIPVDVHGGSDVDREEIQRQASPNALYMHSYLPTHIASTSAHMCSPLPTAPHFKTFPLTRGEARELNSVKDVALGHTFFPPSTYWSPSEKAIFFRSLASCSRLRPDLIAERIRTKTTAEVEAYIYLLDSGLDSTPDEDLLPRAKFPLAHEAPEELIEYEEAQAAMCMEYEEEYAEEMVLETRREEEREWRKEKGIGARVGRPRKGGTRETAKEKRDREIEREHRADIAEWCAERQPYWEAEDALRNMDIVQLGALDRLIKRDERSGPLDDVEAEDGVIVPDLLRGQRVAPDPRECVQPEAGPSNADTVAGPSRLTTSAPVSKSALVTPSAADEEEDPANLSPASKSRLRKRLWMRRKRAAAKGEVADMSRTLLKPGKKAKGAKEKASVKGKGRTGEEPEESGDGTEGDEDDEDGSGSKSAMRKGKGKAVAPASDEGDGDGEDIDAEDDKRVDDDAEHEEDTGGARKRKHTCDERRAKSHTGGRTKPYKFEHALRKVGLDCTALGERGLGGLLSYGGLGKLSRLYASLDPLSAGDAPQKLSGDFLRYLEALVRVYARRAIGMAIRVRELDFALKGHTKVWRLGKRRMVLKHHVARALALVGLPRTSKKAYFAALAARIGNGVGDDGSDEEVINDDEAGYEEEAEAEGDEEGDEEEAVKAEKQEKDAEEDEGEEGAGTAKSGAGWINRHGKLVAPFWPPRTFAAPYITTSHLRSIPTTYPFGIDTPGTRPQLAPSDHIAREAHEAEAAEDLMESDAVELSRELKTEERLNKIDERRGERDGMRVLVALGLISPPETSTAKRVRGKKRGTRDANQGSDDEVSGPRPAKRMRRQGGFKALLSDKLAAADPDGVRVKSAAYVADSDVDL